MLFSMLDFKTKKRAVDTNSPFTQTQTQKN